MTDVSGRLPVGADLQPDGSTRFRVWAPRPSRISLAVVGGDGATIDHPLLCERGAYYTAHLEGLRDGARYFFRLDGGLVPDPASRYQPDGPFGASAVVDAHRFAWTDREWRGVSLQGQVLYEMHVGTFTREGTWRAAADQLPLLADSGISLIEVMPVAEFAGTFGWGYDGVFPCAPSRLYGTPDDMRAFVDRAHAVGIGVLLDVVYNHLGPEGCVFSRYAKEYFSTRYKGEWGDPLNFDDDGSSAVRDYVAANAAYWIREFHLDGLRIDATQGMFDASEEHVLAYIARAARAAAGERSIVLIGENEPQHVRLVRPLEQGGLGLDALWNDDFHHSAVAALTGRCEAYYSDHCGAPQEFISAAKYGYLFQGQRYAWQKKRRGTSSRGVPPAAFVNFIENHDQLANSGDGSRLHARTAPALYRAMTALTLLMPGTPMLFQGQEFGATSPFLYFADLSAELAASVRSGRAEFVSQFPSLATEAMQRRLPVPSDPETFARCKLDWSERDRHEPQTRLHRDLLALRRSEAAFRQQRPGGVDGAVLRDRLFILRFMTDAPEDERLLIVNFGTDVTAGSFAEPLTAAPDGHEWVTAWSSEHPDYGGLGAPETLVADGWRILGHCAVVLRPARTSSRADGASA